MIHENQRFSIFNYTFSVTNLTESDIGLIGGVFSTPFGRKKSLDEVLLPSSSQFEWFWLTEWKVDLLYPKADENGWLYATSFEVPDDSWGMQITPYLFSRSTYVRRRKWIRVRKRRISLTEPIIKNSGSDNNLRITTENDYITEAVELVQSSSPKRRNSSASIKGLNAELELYDEGILVLINGLRSKPLIFS